MGYSQINHKIKHRKEPNDVFYTPIDLAIECISLVNLKKGDFVLDSALGEGAFFNNYPSFVKKDWCEISKDRDFLTYNKKVDWIITNPPFSDIDKWLIKSCEICNKGFGYILGLDKLTARRMEIVNNFDFGLTTFHFFKVYSWFGMSCFLLFEKNKPNILSYNRVVWRNDNSKKSNKNKEKKHYMNIDTFTKS